MTQHTAFLVGGPTSGPHKVSITDDEPPGELSFAIEGDPPAEAVYRLHDRAEDGTVVYSFAGKRDTPSR